ncbi:hypothetical protein BSL78_05876 [Apostichopus japonicus]|uniref:Reverse transcriptase domain-containing protein n=1 Tax=Stichopus japonicus TaxID=307972 RepID=A0A2G8LAE9_STIJA|nr:hypothetical protein BSL78_05876 [Apostichopus japonicus]
MINTASFKIGHIPQIWKSATTIVIPKPGKDHKHPGSYRPISLLPVLGKCLEKIIARRLYKFIEDYNIIPDSQAGFRRNRSTTDQLFHFLQHTSTHRTKGHHTIAAFFDAEKAFDRMWHEGLLLKLRKYNLPTKLTRWIASFLSHRTTNFKIGSSFSSPLHITTGTPQGSTISSINQWCHDWRLELNPKKSQILYIAKHNRLRRQPYLTLNNAVIPVTNQVRFLGIHIDRGLTLGYQHRLTHRKVKQRVRLLFRIAGTTDNPLASPSTTMKIYKMMIRPLIEYAAPAMAHITTNNIEQLEATQRRACRIAYHMSQDTDSETITAIADIPSVIERLNQLRDKF